MILNDIISKKAKKTKQEATEFEVSLLREFDSLEEKNKQNLDRIEEQVDIVKEIETKENHIANTVALISAMVSKNSLLEMLVYNKLEDKIINFPKKTETTQNNNDSALISSDTNSSTKNSINKKEKKNEEFSSSFKNSDYSNKLPTLTNSNNSPNKLASGGISNGNSNIVQSNKIKNLIPYAETLTMPLKASGIAAITTLGKFISSTGGMGAFFAPYMNSMITPFSLSLGVDKNIINNILKFPIIRSTLELEKEKKQFSKTWSKFLNDDKFIKRFIDRDTEKEDEDTVKGGYVPAKWTEDPEFVEAVNNFAKRYNLSGPGLLALMARESGINPSSENADSGAVGLIQIMFPEELGTTKESLKKMTRKEQMVYVEKYLVKVGVKKDMTPADIYALVYLPGRYADNAKGSYGSPERMSTVLTVAGEQFYEQNKGLDYNKDGKTTLYDLYEELKVTAKLFKIQGFEKGGYTDKKLQKSSNITPYLISGSESGYATNIQGIPVTLHGDEVVVPSDNGFQVYPIKNKLFNIFENPNKVGKRWQQISQGSNKQNVAAFASGGTADFWNIAAISAKEDTLHPQGQADVAQALYNRAAIGIYPGGKSIANIITAPGQFEPTFKNPEAWKTIRDRNSAIAAAGNSQLVDMAARSITNPSLQMEAQRFIGGRTDFMGESQKPYMKPGDLTRGKNHNFFGWFYDAKLKSPAPIHPSVSAEMKRIDVPQKQAPKIIVNTVTEKAPPNIMHLPQKTINTIYTFIFNPRKLKTELNMKRMR